MAGQPLGERHFRTCGNQQRIQRDTAEEFETLLCMKEAPTFLQPRVASVDASTNTEPSFVVALDPATERVAVALTGSPATLDLTGWLTARAQPRVEAALQYTRQLGIPFVGPPAYIPSLGRGRGRQPTPTAVAAAVGSTVVERCVATTSGTDSGCGPEKASSSAFSDIVSKRPPSSTPSVMAPASVNRPNLAVKVTCLTSTTSSRAVAFPRPATSAAVSRRAGSSPRPTVEMLPRQAKQPKALAPVEFLADDPPMAEPRFVSETGHYLRLAGTYIALHNRYTGPPREVAYRSLYRRVHSNIATGSAVLLYLAKYVTTPNTSEGIRCLNERCLDVFRHANPAIQLDIVRRYATHTMSLAPLVPGGPREVIPFTCRVTDDFELIFMDSEGRHMTQDECMRRIAILKAERGQATGAPAALILDEPLPDLELAPVLAAVEIPPATGVVPLAPIDELADEEALPPGSCKAVETPPVATDAAVKESPAPGSDNLPEEDAIPLSEEDALPPVAAKRKNNNSGLVGEH